MNNKTLIALRVPQQYHSITLLTELLQLLYHLPEDLKAILTVHLHRNQLANSQLVNT